jgi:hypothetical protein
LRAQKRPRLSFAKKGPGPLRNRAEFFVFAIEALAKLTAKHPRAVGGRQVVKAIYSTFPPGFCLPPLSTASLRSARALARSLSRSAISPHFLDVLPLAPVIVHVISVLALIQRPVFCRRSCDHR